MIKSHNNYVVKIYRLCDIVFFARYTSSSASKTIAKHVHVEGVRGERFAIEQTRTCRALRAESEDGKTRLLRARGLPTSDVL